MKYAHISYLINYKSLAKIMHGNLIQNIFGKLSSWISSKLKPSFAKMALNVRIKQLPANGPPFMIKHLRWNLITD